MPEHTNIYNKEILYNGMEKDGEENREFFIRQLPPEVSRDIENQFYRRVIESYQQRREAQRGLRVDINYHLD